MTRLRTGLAQSCLLQARKHRAAMLHQLVDEQPLITADSLTSPLKSFTTGFFWVNYIVTLALIFGSNLLVGFLALKGNTYTGVWSYPKDPDHEITTVYMDALMISFIMCVVINGLIPGVMNRNVRRAKVVPINAEALQAGIWRVLPVNVRNSLLRAALFWLIFLLLYVVPTFICLYLLCRYKVLHGVGTDDTCQMRIHPEYLWIKAGWAGGLCVIMYPVAYIAALNAKMMCVAACVC